MKKNNIKIYKERCKSCELCIANCKNHIIAISDETNAMGYHPVFITDMSLCDGCTFCAISCPDCVFEITREED